jgi:hypothetical protein
MPVTNGLFFWRMANKAARVWQKRQYLAGTDDAYIYPLGKPVYLQTPGM